MLPIAQAKETRRARRNRVFYPVSIRHPPHEDVELIPPGDDL
jgi:hypothetical protein